MPIVFPFSWRIFLEMTLQGCIYGIHYHTIYSPVQITVMVYFPVDMLIISLFSDDKSFIISELEYSNAHYLFYLFSYKLIAQIYLKLYSKVNFQTIFITEEILYILHILTVSIKACYNVFKRKRQFQVLR